MVEPTAALPELPETRDVIRDPTPVNFPAPHEPAPDTHLPVPLTPHQLEPQATPSASIIAHDPEGQPSGPASVIDGGETILNRRSRTNAARELSSEPEEQDSRPAESEAQDLSMGDADEEEDIDQDLAGTVDSEAEDPAFPADKARGLAEAHMANEPEKQETGHRRQASSETSTSGV